MIDLGPEMTLYHVEALRAQNIRRLSALFVPRWPYMDDSDGDEKVYAQAIRDTHLGRRAFLPRDAADGKADKKGPQHWTLKLGARSSEQPNESRREWPSPEPLEDTPPAIGHQRIRQHCRNQ